MTADRAELNFTDPSTDREVRPELGPVRIHDNPAAMDLTPSQPAAGDSPYVRQYCNEGGTCRMPFALPPGDWKVLWKTPLDPLMMPLAVLPVEDRIVVAGARGWRLLGGGGKPIAAGDVGAGEIVLDPRAGLFHAPDPAGLVMASRLTDGSLVYRLFAFSGNTFRRDLMVRRRSLLTVLSVEYLSGPHSAHQPNLTALDVYDLGSPPKWNEQSVLTSATLRARLVRSSSVTAVVLHQGRFISAIENRIYVFDDLLRAATMMVGEFQPLALSCDDGGRLRLVVKVNEKQELWVLDLEGRRSSRTELAAGTTAFVSPPIAGYDHRTFLVCRDRILAVSPLGKLLWETGAVSSAATVSVDGQLVICQGARVVAYGHSEKPTVLFECPDGPLNTAALLRADGSLLVASAQHLYCLTV